MIVISMKKEERHNKNHIVSVYLKICFISKKYKKRIKNSVFI